MKHFLTFTLILSLFASCKQEQPKQPNILFAIADDASWKHFGAYGCDWVKTPAFDRVAESGILFTRAYTPNAKCAPSRSCILTGRNSWQLEEAVNHFPNFPAKFKTYAEALGENGYWVGSIAKGWAPGNPGEINGKKRMLTGPGFDQFTLTPPAKEISRNDYTRNFEAFLDQKPADQPFCFWYGCTEPHRAYEFETGFNHGKRMEEIDEVPPFWPDCDTVRKDMLDYAFEIEYFDKHLQNMLNVLEEKGELENTIVVVTADNGMPFPRIKGQVYEYSNHLPLAIMWPNGIENPGRKVDDFVNFIDFVPTYLEAANLKAEEIGMQPITGKSLMNIFKSEKSGIIEQERDFMLVGKERHDIGRPDDQGYPVRGIIKDGYLYLRNYNPERWPKGNPETGYLNCDGSPTKTYILDTRRKKGDMEYWQLNFGKRDSLELYNIIDDPYCMNNLAADENYIPLMNKMEAEMVERLTAQEDPRMLGQIDYLENIVFAGKQANFYTRYMSGEEVIAGWVEPTDNDMDLMEE